jgi:hypothetical protein
MNLAWLGWGFVRLWELGFEWELMIKWWKTVELM